MAFSSSVLSSIKSGVDTGSNLISATKRQKYGYTPIQSDPTAAPAETLYFTIEGENSIKFDSDVTDNFLENNEAIQDHATIKPVIITTSSFVGELNNKVEGETLAAIDNFIEEKLTVISGYAPKLTAGATQILNSAKQAFSVAKKAKDAIGSAWDKITGTENEAEKKTLQQTIFDRFYKYWKERTLFLVNTPWAKFENCIIQSFTISQGADTETVSNVEVTFKQLRFVQAYANLKVRGGRNATQAGGAKNLGASTPTVASSWKDSVSKYASGVWGDIKGAWG